ncbi:hypothetical protein ACFOWZ_39990 [Lentzea rhizosphaerae]|uniref:PEP-CTERM protein-sorting domain-containing protein n=1 Tax=Lentzea rhizosphaerae TaxID=2041025 RepID=A0ABV8C758_9PSEU
MIASLIGGRPAGRIPEAVLRRGFGWFVLVMGGFVLAQQLPAVAWVVPVLLVAGGGGAWLVQRKRREVKAGGGPD